MILSINEYKEKVISFIKEAKEKGWVSEEDSHTLFDQISKDELTIGVVGQMNVGKSSLINALIFGKETLPTSETPMTAALTYINYGETPSANVEMLSVSDYEEIKEKTDTEITEDNKEEVESARKIIKSIEAVPSYKDALGKTMNITLSEFDEYVGAGGTYTPMVKFLRLTLNNPELKGYCVVDTPGYNDPVSSRDMTTKKFLSKANVIIMVQDIQSHFSKPDMDLIREQIPNSGIGKLVIVLNKKDSISGDDIERVVENAIEHKQEIISKEEEIAPLLKSCNIIPISSIMSLLGQLSEEEIEKDEALSFWHSQMEYDFPAIRKEDYEANSSVPLLQQEISDIVLRQKKDILLGAPCKKLQALLQTVINKNNIEKESLEETNTFLSDQQFDLESVLQDLDNFELLVTEYMDDTISDSETATHRKIENTRIVLRDLRDAEIKNINFAEKKTKNYLRYCFNTIEDVFIKLNIKFDDTLRQLGSEMSNCLHTEVAELERKMNLIVLHNAQQIHTSVMKRVSKTINSSIPRDLVENQSVDASFPDFWERQDVYQMGIRTYFRKMVQESFSNEYINSRISTYENTSSKLLDTIENSISGIIRDTKKQFDTTGVVDIEKKISENEKRMSKIDEINENVELLKDNVVNLMKLI